MTHPEFSLTEFEMRHPQVVRRYRLLGKSTYGAVFLINGRAVKYTLVSHEAKVARKLQGLKLPGVVRIFGVRKLGEYYVITQERLWHYDGEATERIYDILDVLHGSRRKTTTVVLRDLQEIRPVHPLHLKLIPELCEAIASLREAGFVHGDLTHTKNIMHTSKGKLRLIDFGKARRVR